MSEQVRVIAPFVEAPVSFWRNEALRPTTREWVRHLSLLFITVITTTIAGIALAIPSDLDVPAPPLSSLPDYVLYIPEYYLRHVAALVSFAFSNLYVLAEGLIFSGTLLAILTAHEMGHYLACRRYGVRATLPFFLPAPPLFLAGTFGAFIKIKSPIPTRRALFDIGLAGPLAGFVVTLPIAVAGILMVHPSSPALDHTIVFNDPLLFRAIAGVIGVPLDANAPPNPFYMAAWIGLLVTSLNLMPVGQLDGGHGTFALFGPQAHRWIGRAAFATMAVITVLGWLWHGSPSGFLYTVLLAIMLRVRHPQPEGLGALGTLRLLIAILTLIVFVLSFWPFPITIT